MFHLTQKKTISKEEVAKLLHTDKDALEAFEREYSALLENTSDNFFEINAKQAASMHEGVLSQSEYQIDEMINRIVQELLEQTPVYEFDGKNLNSSRLIGEKNLSPVTKEEIMALPEELRPQLTGTLVKRDIGEPAYYMLLDVYRRYLKEKNPKKKKQFYHLFRQGLDILDLDPVVYEMIGTNPNSMGHWFPQLAKAVLQQDFFKIPKTTIVKVPLPILQLTRVEYETLTRTTLDIVDQFCKEAFHLKEDEEYFVKTGTYSSKFDFRNAHVYGVKEVWELGEYLLFIHYQACQMAAPLNNRCIYGVSTTNEWVVREFIHDTEGNPQIYKGLPLHTEYRLFVDFDSNQVIGMNPYWDPDVMKQRFGHEEDSDSPHNIHDYIIYQMHEKTLMERYEKNKETVRKKMEELLPDIEGLHGQWSVDVMQNGDDFWIIDMALAQDSALHECVPKKLLHSVEENWIPQFEG